MSDIPDDLIAALDDRYHLGRVIGRGGMATVYHARDVRHHRDVAIKVMRQDLASALGTERFLREIRIAAGLTHPNIVGLIDSDEVAGQLFYVMPFIEGESLRQRLRERTRIEPDEALAITTEVADALGYAHRKDIVHRDIKPENILLTEGHAVVTDFGIAKAITRASDEHLTRTGFPLGTVGYMSPEQAAGGDDLSPASDVFSLACVCYEMFTGATPNRWVTEEERRIGRFVESPPEHRSLFDSVPAHVEAALVTAMHVTPSERFATPEEFFRALVDPTLRRSYDTVEVDHIIRRAAEMEEASGEASSPGMSLRSVERLGAEVGIPSGMVRRAADDSRSAIDLSYRKGFLGWPQAIEARRSVQGEVFGNDYAVALEDIRTVLRDPGHAGTLGKTFEWRTTNAGMAGGRDVQVTITPRSGKTHIRAVERLPTKPMVAAVGGLQAAALVAGGTLAFSVGVLWILPAVLAGGFLVVAGAKAYWDRSAESKETELVGLVDRLADRMSGSRSRV